MPGWLLRQRSGAPAFGTGGAHLALDGADGDLLGRTATDCHRFWHHFEPALHLIEHRLMLPSSDALLLASRTQGRDGHALQAI
ncbi:hypothetical protein ASG47_11945 [Devosia sp. Leaf420]|uniref:hypothetical protein n=1 Tax=Devosia sp. Leaf420 TaxID=1736374 RepID=UPI0007159CDC|nr:hypothetical protein [Devosia sp. Leaf420]KQT45671.1 hypothetical protein ASG47_11945 [Devosia sp. Leaf420]